MAVNVSDTTHAPSSPPRQAEAPRELVSYDPATGEEVGRAPLSSAEDVRRAVARARAAQKSWGALSFAERGRVVMRARELVLAEMDEIARLVSRETGKPSVEALSMEMVPTLDLMQFFARRAGLLLRPERIDIGLYRLLGRTSRVEYRPLGVVGIVSPWNFPWATPLGEVVMALVAGNAVVLKPSELTPLVALKMGDIFGRAGLAEGLLEVVTGDGSTGAALVGSGVDKIMFTGSVDTGRRVAEAAARTLTPVVLELGGKDPMIVFEDANLELASSAAVWGAFANAGQACASVERCYVQAGVADAFVARVVEKTRALRLGVGTSEGTDVGPMSSERQLQTVESHVEDAVGRGAKVLTGGRRAPVNGGEGADGGDLSAQASDGDARASDGDARASGGADAAARSSRSSNSFYEPTVLTGVDHTMTLMREETFGPTLPVMTFETEEEALGLANDSPFGLTASVWTRDPRRGRRVASRLEAGTVMVNEVLYTHGIAQAPWGGLKQSGLGRTHGRLGLLEMVAPVHVHTNRLALAPDLWWFNYTPQAAALFRSLARRFATGSALQTATIMPQILRRLLGGRPRS